MIAPRISINTDTSSEAAFIKFSTSCLHAFFVILSVQIVERFRFDFWASRVRLLFWRQAFARHFMRFITSEHGKSFAQPYSFILLTLLVFVVDIVHVTFASKRHFKQP